MPSTFFMTLRATHAPSYLRTSSSVSSNFNDTERAALRALALLVDDGLSATLEEVVRTPAWPVSADALHTLRVATVLTRDRRSPHRRMGRP
jgi:hypothetical protein